MRGQGSCAGGWTRREVLRAATCAPMALAGLHASVRPERAQSGATGALRTAVRIRRTDSTFEREPLIRPFGFKGGYMSEIWETAVRMEADGGGARVGIGTQNVRLSRGTVSLLVGLCRPPGRNPVGLAGCDVRADGA